MRVVADVFEDTGAVEGDNCEASADLFACESGKKGKHTINATHLLRNHDCRSTIVGASDPRNGEAVPQTGKVGRAGGHANFLLIDDPGVVVVPNGDDVVCTKATHGLECLGLLAVLHEPTWGLGAKEDADSKDQRGNKGRAELQTPLEVVPNAQDGDISKKTEEDA